MVSNFDMTIVQWKTIELICTSLPLYALSKAPSFGGCYSVSTSEDERVMNSYEDAANQFVCSPLLARARLENAPLLQASQMSNGGAGSKLMVDSHRGHRLEICMKRTVRVR